MSKTNFHTRDAIKNLTTAAVCLALCMILPFLTAQNQALGNALGLMHIPVLLCGFVTGPSYAMIIGLVAPITRMLMIGMPPPFVAVPMCFELAVYGLLTGLLHRAFPKRLTYTYITLILSMLIGRFVWGLASRQVAESVFFPDLLFGWEEFIAGAFVIAWPGIVLHIVLIPLIVAAMRKARLVD